MAPDENLFMLILGLIGVLLGGVMLRNAARLDEALGRRYRLRGTAYFVAGCGPLTLFLLRSL